MLGQFYFYTEVVQRYSLIDGLIADSTVGGKTTVGQVEVEIMQQVYKIAIKKRSYNEYKG